MSLKWSLHLKLGILSFIFYFLVISARLPARPEDGLDAGWEDRTQAGRTDILGRFCIYLCRPSKPRVSRGQGRCDEEGSPGFIFISTKSLVGDLPSLGPVPTSAAGPQVFEGMVGRSSLTCLVLGWYFKSQNYMYRLN